MEQKQIKVLIPADAVAKKISELADQLNERFGSEEIYYVCVLKGGVVFAVDLMKHLKMPIRIEFIRLSSYGSGTSTTGSIKAIDLQLPDLNGKNVVITEDIVDSGITAKFLIDYIKEHFQTKCTIFCSLLNKPARRKVEVEPDYYCFNVDDKFVVGCGLDFDGHYRNLDYIGYMEWLFQYEICSETHQHINYDLLTSLGAFLSAHFLYEHYYLIYMFF